MSTAITIFVIALVIGMILDSANKQTINEPSSSKKEELVDSFYQMYNQEGNKLVRDMEQYYLGISFPENFPSVEYFKEFLPSVTDDMKMTFQNLFPIIGLNTEKPEYGSDEYKAQQHFQNLVEVLTFRKNADQDDVYEGSNEKEAAEKYGINLFKDEILVLTNGFSTWKEEKTKTTSISYGGIRLSSGKGALKTVFGNVSMVRHQQTYFSKFDTGTLFVTTKRIIFVGQNKRNKSIRLDRVMNLEIFEDGFFIGKDNGVSPMITFFELPNNESEPWSYTKQLTSRVPEMVSHINRLLHNDVTVKA